MTTTTQTAGAKERDQATEFSVPNFHCIRVRFLPATNTLGYRIKLISDRFKGSITLDRDDAFDRPIYQAIAWLQSHGVEVIGRGDTTREEILLIKTWKSIGQIANS